MHGSASLILNVLFGSVGVGYFIYGKKQQNLVALLAGLALCGFPYLLSNPYLIILVGLVVMSLPLFLRS